VDLTARPTIAVLGASGLIGQGVAEALGRDGYPVVAVARRFTAAQRAAFGAASIQAPFVGFDAARLAGLFEGVDIVLNCVGVLQDGPRGGTSDAHAGFVGRLIAALRAQPRPILLLHLSIPGDAAADATAFARSKRAADGLIAASGLPHAILRPGFVIAPAAFGGSALVRGLAALPLALDARNEAAPFAVTALADLAATVCTAARLWRDGWPGGGFVWDVMARRTPSVGEVIDAVRARFGGPRPRLRLPASLLTLGALAGDAVAWLGWSPPVRTTALAELRRGVAGDPAGWIAATGLEPATLEAALAAVPASVQEIWFARLFFAKPLLIGVLAAFWIGSGLVALGPGWPAAVSILTQRSVPPDWTVGLALVTALADVAIGVGLAVRRTCRSALVAGVALSLGYLVAATVVAPDLWFDPLGPLLKIVPIMALMLVALAILPERWG
jgi:uncharacterized protein YbjT (DUF2867 family)